MLEGGVKDSRLRAVIILYVIMNIFEQSSEWTWLTIGTAGAALILMIWIWILTVKYSRLQKSLRRMMGESGVPTLDEVMENVHASIKNIEVRQQSQHESITRLEQGMRKMKGNVGVYRYNAFSDTGSDLSFSVAMIDAHKDGVVISGIHSRDNTFMYAKPIKTGESKYTLTQEEKQAITLALPNE